MKAKFILSIVLVVMFLIIHIIRHFSDLTYFCPEDGVLCSSEMLGLF
jgi:hypothetical protein